MKRKITKKELRSYRKNFQERGMPKLPKEVWLTRRFLGEPGEIIGVQTEPRKDLADSYVRYVLADGSER